MKNKTKFEYCGFKDRGLLPPLKLTAWSRQYEKARTGVFNFIRNCTAGGRDDVNPALRTGAYTGSRNVLSQPRS